MSKYDSFTERKTDKNAGTQRDKSNKNKWKCMSVERHLLECSNQVSQNSLKLQPTQMSINKRTDTQIVYEHLFVGIHLAVKKKQKTNKKKTIDRMLLKNIILSKRNNTK